jgi:Family of unknown function (DUF6499)
MPDWRDPAQYPRDRSPLRQWAWEFLRRNPEYRAGWREHIEPFYDPAWRRDQDVGAVGPAHGAPADKQAELVHHFGLDSFPPSPDDGLPPLFTRTGLRYTAEREARMLLHPGQIAVIFDLTRPIRRQLAAAKMVFDEEKRRGEIPGPHRNRIELFAPYLRVLDGVAAGATHSAIGDMLFGDGRSERLSLVRDYLDAAKKLRDGDYLFIAAGVEPRPD